MIELSRQDGLWAVTLNRPGKANSLTGAMQGELCEIAESPQDAGAFVLTGRGHEFSAGADLDEAATGRLAVSPLCLCSAVAALPCLSITALNGPSRSRPIPLAGQKISAAEALAFGLVDRVVAPEDLMRTAEALAADSRNAGPALVAGVADLIDSA